MLIHITEHEGLFCNSISLHTAGQCVCSNYLYHAICYNEDEIR